MTLVKSERLFECVPLLDVAYMKMQLIYVPSEGQRLVWETRMSHFWYERTVYNYVYYCSLSIRLSKLIISVKILLNATTFKLLRKLLTLC